MKIKITGPQFERADSLKVEPLAAPQGSEWLAIDTWQPDRLRALGCQVWEETDTYIHWLFPEQWYLFIPEGFVVTFINDRSEPFKPGITNDDIRFGCLAFGVKIEK